MHFKIGNKNVTLFPPGMSAAVLWANHSSYSVSKTVDHYD